jgi:hypothetical protein
LPTSARLSTTIRLKQPAAEATKEGSRPGAEMRDQARGLDLAALREDSEPSEALSIPGSRRNAARAARQTRPIAPQPGARRRCNSAMTGSNTRRRRVWVNKFIS